MSKGAAAGIIVGACVLEFVYGFLCARSWDKDKMNKLKKENQILRVNAEANNLRADILQDIAERAWKENDKLKNEKQKSHSGRYPWNKRA